MRRGGWGSQIRARIKLRKLKGREPTKDEVKNFSDHKDVTITDIREALDRGDEVRSRMSNDR